MFKTSTRRTNHKSLSRHCVEFSRQWDMQLMVLPAILLIVLFSYVPMYGIIMAFQEYKLGDFPGTSQWVGLKQFQILFRDPNFMNMLRNTLAINGLKLLICFPAPILFAVLLNEIKVLPFKKTVQTISYLPHFISWVVAAKLMFDLFTPDNGAVNNALKGLGMIDRPIHFFGQAKYFWGMLIGTDIWKELGWNAIIFVAAITAIDSDLYEAADIDGAGRYSKMWYVTIASIMPTIVLLLIFDIGWLLDANFDQIMMLTNQMGNAKLRSAADVIDTYVYRVGVKDARYSFGTAAGLFKSVISFVLLMSANATARKLGQPVLY